MAERVTTAALYEIVKSIKEDTTEIKLNDKEQWKSINKNSESIAGIKGTAFGISGCVSFIVSVAGILWSMFKAKSS